VLLGEALQHRRLLRAFAAAAYREVFAANHDLAAVDAGEATDVPVREEAVVGVVEVLAAEHADFCERARVDELGDAFANGETTRVVLPFDALFAAHAQRPLAALRDLSDSLFPTHLLSPQHVTAGPWHRAT